MKNNTKTDIINNIMHELESLPKGNITYKVIRGRERMYLQWTEDGKRRSRYIRQVDEPYIMAQMERRRFLEEQLRRGTYKTNDYSLEEDTRSWYVAEDSEEYNTYLSHPWTINVVTGNLLAAMTEKTRPFNRRDSFDILQQYLEYDDPGKVCILYGLRRTGKTTMLFQAISQLPPDETAYIKITSGNSMSDLNSDLRYMATHGFRYVFIDEITLMSDFISSASLLSDIYAQSGMKIVLSGTDSLGFALSSDDELYDRAVMIHTTFIPFKEYSRLLGINDADEYIRYGGTLRAADPGFSLSSKLSHDRSFESDESARKYIDTAIAHNIQHSLINYDNGGHFRHLLDLYEADELTSAINRIVEDMNHKFVLSVLTREWISHDLGSAAQLLRKKYAAEWASSPLDHIDTAEITNRLKDTLSIVNQGESCVHPTGDYIAEIKKYLKLLDLIQDCPADGIGVKTPSDYVLFTQPGLRYCQAKTLVESLMKDDFFSALPPSDRRAAIDTILNDVRGRILEEMILIETSRSLDQSKSAFKLYFAIGEIDMVVFDADALTCRLFEVKHSSAREALQYKHLIDKDKCSAIEQKYGNIVSRTVIYRGDATTIKDGEYTIEYLNAEDYLMAL